MADEADMAHELEQLALNQALAARKPVPRLAPKGICYNCHEPLKPTRHGRKVQHEKIFCDSDCAEDWEKSQTAKRHRLF